MTPVMRDAAIPELARATGATAFRVRNEITPQRTMQPYDAASRGPRLQNWRPSTVSANSILGSLSILRDRSRQATRNDGYARGVIERLVSAIVGTGITPLPKVKDGGLKRALQALWLKWTDESDASGQLEFYGQQKQAVRTWLEAGECFLRLRQRLPEDMLSVPLQIEVLEPEQCPYAYTGFATNGNRIRAGIEFDALGRRVAYYFHPSRPDLDDYDQSVLRRIPAEAVIHLYEPMRPGQLRGIPHLTPALLKLYDLGIFDDATLLKQQIQNLFAVFVTRPNGVDDVTPIDPLTGVPLTDTVAERPVVELAPGMLQELATGQDVKFATPPNSDSGYADFMRQQLRAVAIATGVPYELLTGDMSSMNDRTARVMLNEFRRYVQMLQHQSVAFKLCQPVWNEWLDQAALARSLALPSDYFKNRDEYTAVQWVPQRSAYIHPVQDVEAAVAAVLAGFDTRSNVVAEFGEDAESIDDRQAEDNARADELGLKYTSDARFVTSKKTLAQADPVVGAAA